MYEWSIVYVPQQAHKTSFGFSTMCLLFLLLHDYLWDMEANNTAKQLPHVSLPISLLQDHRKDICIEQ
jgi:hypothetical protein